MTRPAIAIHGGCGVMARPGLTEAEWQRARTDLARALKAGWHILQQRSVTAEVPCDGWSDRSAPTLF